MKKVELARLARPTRAALSVVLCLSCASSPTPYRGAMAQAEEARRAQRFSQEREHFGEAARLATKPKDAAEARYRAAVSWVREGKHEEGARALEQFARDYPDSPRAARAWLDSGRAWERAGAPEAAETAFAVVVAQHPESGGALSAARRLVALRSAVRGTKAHVEWKRLLDANRSRTFDEALRYHYAKSLDESAPAEALLVYESVATEHPLPTGTFSDEALLRAAEIRRQLGDADGAIELLDKLSAQGGKAAFVGSYTRTAYIEALLLKGRILRDDLKQHGAASDSFLLLAKKYPRSRLLDDALWEDVRTQMELDGDACEAMTRLERLAPHSRFIRCKPLVCGESMDDPRRQEKCEAWIESENSAGEEGDE